MINVPNSFASTMYVSDFQYLITEQIAQYFIPCNSVQYVHIMIKKSMQVLHVRVVGCKDAEVSLFVAWFNIQIKQDN